MSNFVLAINSKGEQRTFSDRTWHLMRSMKEQGNTRKGWTFVKDMTAGEQRDFERSLGKKSVTPQAPATGLPKAPKTTFIPKEIEEHAKKKAEEAAAGAGEKVKPEEALATEQPQASEQEAPLASAEGGPAGEAPGADVAGEAQPDDLLQLPNIGKKSADALNAAGITTFKGLVDAGPAKIEAILTGAGLGAKTPVVPKWMVAAAEKVAKA